MAPPFSQHRVQIGTQSQPNGGIDRQAKYHELGQYQRNHRHVNEMSEESYPAFNVILG